ncbi:MAG: hypothetical protein V9G09_15620 [Candidatus Nanopelagicales bacterium]
MRTSRNFIDTQDLGPDVIRAQMDLIRLLKQADKQNACPRLLEGASLGMIFEEASTRTRVSFEVAMTKLGGPCVCTSSPERSIWARRRTSPTPPEVLSAGWWTRWRSAPSNTRHRHRLRASTLEVPVINGLTDYNHPTQAVCDVFTMTEHTDKPFSELTVVFVGDATNVCTSTAHDRDHARWHVHPRPPGAVRDQGAVADRPGRDRQERGTFTAAATSRPRTSRTRSSNADYIYTDLWWWFGQEAEIPDRVKAFKPRYQVNAQLMARAPEHAKFMHCLPASRGVEATDEVMDSAQSIIYDQSENRLHTEKGLLAWYITPNLEHPTPALRAYHEGRIESFLHDAVTR